MLVDMIAPAAHLPVLAKAAITWTPKTFYIAAGIVQAIVILITFKVLQVDPEHNTFVGAVIGAALCNLGAYALAPHGLFGVLAAGTAFFVMLVAISSGEVLKSAIAFMVLMAAYGGMGLFITHRTPLKAANIGGLPQVIITGGLKAEPITEKESNKLAAPAGAEKTE